MTAPATTLTAGSPTALPVIHPAIHPAFQHDLIWHRRVPPEHRLARVAARRAFVEMKQCFMRAASEANTPDAPVLQLRIRQADDVTDLWRVSQALFAALSDETPRHRRLRAELRLELDAAFPAKGDTRPLEL